jgi:hypothetical protein
MAYTRKNYRTKKALKEDLADGKEITVFQPGPFGPDVPPNGTVFLEGPHYPEAHKWYAEAVMENGVVVKVK